MPLTSLLACTGPGRAATTSAAALLFPVSTRSTAGSEQSASI
ncbi:hypothetical protein ACGFX2_31555 [Streptomyces goshikiensis]